MIDSRNLILTRRIGESIMVGDNVKINVMGIDRGYVKLSVKAPEMISVHREEIYKRIKDGMK